MSAWARGAWVVVWLAAAQAAGGAIVSNVLVNPGFEQGSGTTISQWMVFNDAQRVVDHVHSGSHAMRVTGNDWPPDQYNGSGVCQDFPASAGQVWEGSAWVSTWLTDPLQSTNLARVTINFYDSATNALWPVYSMDKLTGAGPTGEWIKVVARATAPVNTEFVRFTVALSQPADWPGGSAWFDDAEFGRSTITDALWFAGQAWGVLEGDAYPGPNPWAAENAWVDTNGWLHLRIGEVSGRWCCAMANNFDSTGYGTYRWRLRSRVDWFSSDTVLGLFTYEPTKGDSWNEIDFEFTRSFEGMAVSNVQFAIQPWFHAGNLRQVVMVQTNPETTHRFLWTPGDIRFQSYQGHDPDPSDTNAIFGEWVYAGGDVPVHSNEVVYMNFYLWQTNAPGDTQYVEVVVTDFEFTPFDGVYVIDEFDDNARSNFWALNGVYPWLTPVIRETNGRLCVSADGDWETAGYISTNTVNWNNRKEWFVFSALLSSVSVDTARSGDDLRTVLSLSSERENSWIATNAIVLYGKYDGGDGSLDFTLEAKTNLPLNNAIQCFSGTLANASSYLASGGIEMKMALGRGAYRLELNDASGAGLPVTTNAGSLTGAHNLGESLRNSYWLVGAMNEETGRGTVCWERTAVGVDLPPGETEISVFEPVAEGLRMSWPSCFARTYDVCVTTDLVHGAWSPRTNVAATPPANTHTDAVAGAAAAFYRVEVKGEEQ